MMFDAYKFQCIKCFCLYFICFFILLYFFFFLLFQVIITLGILQTLATALGPHCKQHVRTVGPGIINCLGDSKVTYNFFFLLLLFYIVIILSNLSRNCSVYQLKKNVFMNIPQRSLISFVCFCKFLTVVGIKQLNRMRFHEKKHESFFMQIKFQLLSYINV